MKMKAEVEDFFSEIDDSKKQQYMQNTVKNRRSLIQSEIDRFKKFNCGKSVD